MSGEYNRPDLLVIGIDILDIMLSSRNMSTQIARRKRQTYAIGNFFKLSTGSAIFSKFHLSGVKQLTY